MPPSKPPMPKNQRRDYHEAGHAVLAPLHRTCPQNVLNSCGQFCAARLHAGYGRMAQLRLTAGSANDGAHRPQNC